MWRFPRFAPRHASRVTSVHLSLPSSIHLPSRTPSLSDPGWVASLQSASRRACKTTTDVSITRVTTGKACFLPRFQIILWLMAFLSTTQITNVPKNKHKCRIPTFTVSAFLSIAPIRFRGFWDPPFPFFSSPDSFPLPCVGHCQEASVFLALGVPR